VIQQHRCPLLAEPGLRGIALVLTLVVLPAPCRAGGGPADAPSSALWRRPENDGLNCLFLQLRGLGYPGRYEDYVQAVARRPRMDELSGLSAAAKELGYGLEPARLTMAELESMRAPILVHMEQRDRDTGHFGIVAGFARDETGEHVILFYGGIATVEPVLRDTFRREWSGYALVPTIESGWGPWIRRSTAALSIALAAVAVGSTVFKPN
jgi:hypothetical protein